MKQVAWHEFAHIAFDLDGTLLNSNIAHVWAWQDAIEAEHLFFPHLTMFLQMGLPGKQIAEKFLFALRDRATAQRIVERSGEIYADKYLPLVAPFDGTYRLLASLKSRGRRLYALTSASRVEAESMIKRFRLERYFDWVLNSEESGEGKPTSQPFSRLKERIGSRAQLISIGDSPYDFKAAMSSGVPFVYVGNGGFPREWFHRAQAVFFNVLEMVKSVPKTRRHRERVAA